MMIQGKKKLHKKSTNRKEVTYARQTLPNTFVSPDALDLAFLLLGCVGYRQTRLMPWIVLDSSERDAIAESWCRTTRPSESPGYFPIAYPRRRRGRKRRVDTTSDRNFCSFFPSVSFWVRWERVVNVDKYTHH